MKEEVLTFTLDSSGANDPIIKPCSSSVLNPADIGQVLHYTKPLKLEKWKRNGISLLISTQWLVSSGFSLKQLVSWILTTTTAEVETCGKRALVGQKHLCEVRGQRRAA